MDGAKYTSTLVADDIGRLADEMSDVLEAGKLDVPTRVKSEMAQSFIKEWMLILRKMYKDITDENSWETAND